MYLTSSVPSVLISTIEIECQISRYHQKVPEKTARVHQLIVATAGPIALIFDITVGSKYHKHLRKMDNS